MNNNDNKKRGAEPQNDTLRVSFLLGGLVSVV